MPAAEILIERYKKKLCILEQLVAMPNDAVLDLLHELAVDFENQREPGNQNHGAAPDRRAGRNARIGVRFDAMRTLLIDNGPMLRRDLINHLAGDDPKAKSPWRSAVANHVGSGKILVTEDGYVMLPEQAERVEVDKDRAEDGDDEDGDDEDEDDGDGDDEGDRDDEVEDGDEDDRPIEPAYIVYSADGTDLGHYDDLADAKRAMRRSEPGAHIKDADGTVLDTKPLPRKGR